MKRALCVLLAASCQRSERIEERPPSPDAPTWQAPPPAPTTPPEQTTDTGPAPLLACDLQGVVPTSEFQRVRAEDVQWGSISGEGGPGWFGMSVAVVESGEGAGTIVAGAPGLIPLVGYYTYYYGTPSEKPAAELWVFDGPLPEGFLDRSMARSVLLGRTGGFWASFEGMELAVGELTGDGQMDVVSGGYDLLTAPYDILSLPTPEGQHNLDEVATASYSISIPDYGAGSISAGDWNGDGIGDVAFGATGDANPNGDLSALEDNFYGAEIFLGPLSGAHVMGEGSSDGAVAWFDMFEPSWGGPGQTGLYSSLIPDINGDDAADILVSGYLIGISPNKGWGTESFGLFSGNVSGRYERDAALAHLHVPCDPVTAAPVSVGDVTGDGRPDTALRGPGADVEGESTQEGAIWVLSELHTLAESPPGTVVSVTDYSGAVLLGHGDDYITDVDGLDFDQDGQQDLAVLTTRGLYLFLGPLTGVHDLDDADIVVEGLAGDDLAVGDVTGDELPDFVVGLPIALGFWGEVRVYDGAAILAALP